MSAFERQLDRLLLGPCEAAFGDPAIVYTPKNGAPLTIAGVFDRANLQQQPFGGGAQEAARAGAAGNVTALRPVLGVRLAQFGGAVPQQRDRVELPSQGLAFTIQEVRPDGKGWALLLLTKA